MRTLFSVFAISLMFGIASAQAGPCEEACRAKCEGKDGDSDPIGCLVECVKKCSSEGQIKINLDPFSKSRTNIETKELGMICS